MTTISPIAILKSGSFDTIGGGKVSFAERDMDEIASSYDAVRDPAPIVVAQPAIDTPAYGWIGRMAVVGGQLLAYPSEMAPALAQARAAGQFAKVSPQFYRPDSPSNPQPGKWYLQHVGLLGGTPPPITGLGSAAFATRSTEGVVMLGGTDAAGDALAHVQARAKAIQAARPGMAFLDAWSRAKEERRQSDHVAELEAKGEVAPVARMRVIAAATRLMNDNPAMAHADAMASARKAEAIATVTKRSVS
jgi:hypothetical protein